MAQHKDRSSGAHRWYFIHCNKAVALDHSRKHGEQLGATNLLMWQSSAFGGILQSCTMHRHSDASKQASVTYSNHTESA